MPENTISNLFFSHFVIFVQILSLFFFFSLFIKFFCIVLFHLLFLKPNRKLFFPIILILIIFSTFCFCFFFLFPQVPNYSLCVARDGHGTGQNGFYKTHVIFKKITQSVTVWIFFHILLTPTLAGFRLLILQFSLFYQ